MTKEETGKTRTGRLEFTEEGGTETSTVVHTSFWKFVLFSL
jgi:hypothetical protein